MVTENMIEAPAGWMGTLPEYLVYRELTRLKVEFQYQSSQMGGRQERGGSVADFLITDLNLVLNVQSLYWHYGRPEARLADRIQKEQLEAMGLTVIYLDEDDLLRNARWYVEQALMGNDFSQVNQGAV
uniref:DUF559 domain-containing protein n=1 Tax=viral metagenome TaxID=1070528 RepID=A0A6M3IJ02_9ZZZZ